MIVACQWNYCGITRSVHALFSNHDNQTLYTTQVGMCSLQCEPCITPPYRNRSGMATWHRGYRTKPTKSSPTGPAEQDEGGSLYRHHLVIIFLSWTAGCFCRGVEEAKSRGSAPRRRGWWRWWGWNTKNGQREEGYSPSQVWEFLINSLESHFERRGMWDRK